MRWFMFDPFGAPGEAGRVKCDGISNEQRDGTPRTGVATTRAGRCRARTPGACGVGAARHARAKSPGGRCSLQVPAALVREQGSTGRPGGLVPQRERQRLADSTHLNNGDRRGRDGHALRIAGVPPRRLGRGLRRVLPNDAALTTRGFRLLLGRGAAWVDLILRAAAGTRRILGGAAATGLGGPATAVGLGRQEIAATDRDQRLEQQAEDDAKAGHLLNTTSVGPMMFDSRWAGWFQRPRPAKPTIPTTPTTTQSGPSWMPVHAEWGFSNGTHAR